MAVAVAVVEVMVAGNAVATLVAAGFGVMMEAMGACKVGKLEVEAVSEAEA